MHEVNSRVLTLEFVRDLVLEVNALLDRDAPSLTVRISELKRNLAEVETAIHVLLDLAEQFGAASAASRLLEREGEQRQMQAELRYLEDQRERTRDNVPEEKIQQVLRGMRETLDSTDLEAKRSLLRKLVAWVELGKAGGKVALTFPLRDADLCPAPPGEFFIKVRTLVYAAPG